MERKKTNPILDTPLVGQKQDNMRLKAKNDTQKNTIYAKQTQFSKNGLVFSSKIREVAFKA